MLNFTVGPVQTWPEILEIGGKQVPYFRNQSFSKIMLENEKIMKELTYAEDNSKVVFLTASGTGAMEAAVMNSFTSNDLVLIVDGGSFGHRFAQICEIHNIPYKVVKVPIDNPLTKDMLEPYNNKGFTGFLVNMCETSIAKLYDMQMISDFCKKNNLFLIVDGISSFLADPVNIREMEIDVFLTGSQKALALPPGISILVFNERAINRINQSTANSMYFDIKDALKNGERGQTPFTPAVSILLQMNYRLKMIMAHGGAKYENDRIAELAADFRKRILDLPVEILDSSLSNSVTAVKVKDQKNAYKIFEILEKQYEIWICPNGGDLKEKIFRVGHLGNLTVDDNRRLVEALKKIFNNWN